MSIVLLLNIDLYIHDIIIMCKSIIVFIMHFYLENGWTILCPLTVFAPYTEFWNMDAFGYRYKTIILSV